MEDISEIQDSVDESHEIPEAVSALDAIASYSSLLSTEPVETSEMLAEVGEGPTVDDDDVFTTNAATSSFSEQDEEDYVAESLSVEDFNEFDVPQGVNDTSSELSPSDEADFNQARFIDTSDVSEVDELADDYPSADEVPATPELKPVEAPSVEEVSLVASASAVEDGHAASDLASVPVEALSHVLPAVPSTPPKPSRPMNAVSTKKRVRDLDGETNDLFLEVLVLICFESLPSQNHTFQTPTRIIW